MLYGIIFTPTQSSLADTLWRLYYYYEGLFSQANIWLILTVIGALRLLQLIIFSIPYRQPKAKAQAASTGQLQRWLELLYMRDGGRRLFVRPFRYLVLTLLGQEKNLTYQQSMNLLQNQGFDMSPDLQTYLAKETRSRHKQARFVGEEPEIAEILQVVETYLER